MNDDDLELTARFTAIETVLSMLFAEALSHRTKEQGDILKESFFDKPYHPRNGLFSVEDMEDLRAATEANIRRIFEKADQDARPRPSRR